MEDNIKEARLGLCEAELKALEQWLAVHFNKNSNIADVAHFAMLFALTNPKKFSDWINTIARYCKAEDMHQFNYLRSRIAAQYLTQKLKIA